MLRPADLMGLVMLLASVVAIVGYAVDGGHAWAVAALGSIFLYADSRGRRA